MNEIEDQRKVVCFLQPNFTQVLKSGEAGEKRFTVKVFDDCDTIHVRVLRNNKAVQAGPEKRVAFKVFKELPPSSEILEICSKLIFSLPALDEPQVAIVFHKIIVQSRWVYLVHHVSLFYTPIRAAIKSCVNNV